MEWMVISDIFSTLSVGIAALSAAFFGYYIIRTGLLARLRFDSLEASLAEAGPISAKISIEDLVKTETLVVGKNEVVQFEKRSLEAYYNQALFRTNVSFWFSLIFAAVGFGVIILAFMTHNPADLTGSLLKVGSGVVIDAVSGLFFVQATSAQKAMQEFFEKLRLDRASADAREIISEITDPDRADQLRAQLVLKYAGIEKLLVG